jgi:hypothetical protein
LQDILKVKTSQYGDTSAYGSGPITSNSAKRSLVEIGNDGNFWSGRIPGGSSSTSNNRRIIKTAGGSRTSHGMPIIGKTSEKPPMCPPN